MEVVGIGTEIIECPRIGRMIEHHGELFLRRVYTEREIRFCQARKHAIEHFAALWAAKEAIFKAIGINISRGVAWTEIEVRKSSGGRQKVWISGEAKAIALRLGIADVLISTAHCRTYATAHALAVKGPPARLAPAIDPPPSAGESDESGD